MFRDLDHCSMLRAMATFQSSKTVHKRMALGSQEGSGSLGDIATFSFYPTKNLGAFGDGGAIASSDTDLLTRCKQLHQYGWASKYTISVPNGRNSRMDEVQAAILIKFLPGLDDANKRRVRILNSYDWEAAREMCVSCVATTALSRI